LRYFFSPGLGLLVCLFNNNKKSSIFGKCKDTFTPKVKRISLRLKEMHIYACAVEGAAQINLSTNLSAVLPFWIKEE